MPERVPICVALPDYVAAAAELPRSVVRERRPHAAIVVVHGGGDWWSRVGEARGEGALAVIVEHPDPVPPTAWDALERDADAAPVFVDRRLFRHDMALDAARATPAVAVTAEVLAHRDRMPTVLVDAVAWLRSLGGAEPIVTATEGDASGVLSLLEAGIGGTPLSILATVDASGATEAIRLLAIGASRTEVVLEPSTGIARVSTSDANGERVSPRRFETPARSTLRRVLAAIESGDRLSDIRMLRRDTEIAAELHFG